MSLIEVNWNPERRELRQFALLWLGFFALVGAYCYWGKSLPTAAVAFCVTSAAGLVGYFLPSMLRPIYVLWMALALPIGWVVSHLLLLVVFYLVVTPIGLAMRLIGYDPLNRRFDGSAKSYWTRHDPSGDAARYFKQY